MSSTAQVIANQANAQYSTGPKTPAGKAASAQNAARHNLAGNFRVLPNESQADFDRLLESNVADFKPATEHENFCVRTMVQASWKLARIERLETSVIEQMMALAGSDDADGVVAMAMINKMDGPLKCLQRYAVEARRAYRQAHSDLLKSKAETENRNEANAEPGSPASVSESPQSGACPRHAATSEVASTPDQSHPHDAASSCSSSPTSRSAGPR